MSTSPARSRRDRPAKPALSREWIVATTIEIMRREGLAKATMRRVAQALDTGPASLYVYVANTAELHAAVLDELVGALPDDTEGRWDDRLEALLLAYAEVLFAHPGLARSALFLRPLGPNALRLYDRVLGLLLEGGIAPDRAAWGMDLLLQHMTATAAEHSEPGSDDVDAPDDDDTKMQALDQVLRNVDPQLAPHLVEHVDAVLGGAPGARTTWAIRTLLAGIATTPTAGGAA